jgi:hypothetical protein
LYKDCRDKEVTQETGKDAVRKLIKKTFFEESLHEDPEYVMHYQPEDWAGD